MKKAQLYIFIWTFLLGVLTPILPAFAACNGSTPSCSSLSSSCKGNQALQGSASAKMDIKCLLNNSSGSCFDQVPMSGGSGNYNSIGKRSSTRNHYGVDIGAGGKTGLTAKAPADDGEIVYAKLAGGSGPTLVINYKKKCEGGGDGPEGGYHVVFRHLCRIYKSGGKVHKGEEVGLVGGGNTVGGKACQNPAQKDICPTNCSKGWYDIHLHFELLDGELCGSCSTQANPSKVIAPYCKDAAVLCGGCSAEKSCECVRNCGGAFGGSGSVQDGVGDTEQTEGEVGVESAKSCQLAQFLDSNSCVFCDLFKIIFNTASELSLTAINNLAIPSRNLVITGFLIWVFFYILKQISTFSATSTGEMLKGLIYQGFRVAVVVLILNGAIFQVMNLTLSPVMQTGFNFANSLNTNSTCNDSAEYMQNIKGYEGNYTDGNVSGGLPINVGKSIVCSIKNLEDGTGILMGLGSYSICLGHNKHRFMFGILPGLSYIFTGWLLQAVGAILMITFPWCLIDCVLQLCIAAALIPCAIAAFAFKITQKYIKIVWNFFMNAMFNFVFMAIIVYIINSNLISWIGLPHDILSGNVIFPDEYFVRDGILSNTSAEANPKYADSAFHIEGIAWWGSAAIKIVGICFLCWSFFDEAAAMAKRFADSAGIGGKKGIGRMVGGDLAQKAKNYVGAPAMHYAGRGANALGHGINAVAGNKFRSGMNHLKGQGMNLLGKIGIANSQVTKRDAATGKPLEYKSKIRIFGRDIERTVSRGENGWISDKTSHKRTEIDKAFEAVKDENGNAVLDANGRPKYVSRQRSLGLVDGYEEMTSSVDANGNIHYQTADGSRSFTMNPAGEIISYKTPYTAPVLGMFGTPRERTDRHKYGTTHTVNDGLSRTVKKLDANGREISSSTKYMNSSSANLLEKDGTINANAFNQIKNGSDSAETAATYMVGEVMKSRGMELSDSYVDRDVRINDDGSFTISQKTEIGKDKNKQPVYERQIINAKIVGNQMVLNITSHNSEGDITHHLSNGMQTKVTKYNVKLDKAGNKIFDKDGKLVYTKDEKLFFSDYLNRHNSGHGVLDTKGRWGNQADRDKIMTGFTREDYDKHLTQLMLKELKRTMTKAEFNKLLNTAGSDISIKYGKLHLDSVSQAQIMALNAAAASLLGIQLPDPTQGSTSIPNPDPSTPIQDQNPTTPQPNPDDRSPNNEERAKTEEEQRKEAEERAKEAEERVKKAEEEKRQKEAEEKAKAEEEKRQKEAEEKAKAEEQKRQKEAEEKAKAEEQKRQKDAEEETRKKEAKEKSERLQDEYKQHETERAQLEKERDEITKQFAEVNAQLSAAKDAINAAGITEAEKRERQAAYNELLRQSNQLKEQLGKVRKESNAKINDYNSRVRKHNDEIPNKRLK